MACLGVSPDRSPRGIVQCRERLVLHNRAVKHAISFRRVQWLVPAALLLVTAPQFLAPVTASGVQTELDALARAGGGVYLLPAARVPAPNGVVVPSGVTLDLNGGELITVLTNATAAGVRLMSDSAVRNGSVTVVSQGSPASQAGAHAPILVGALVGENTAPGRLSPFEAPNGWTISNVTLRSDKRVKGDDLPPMGSAAIQVIGGARDGLIENVTVPDSALLSGGVLLDWGTVGPISSHDVSGSAAVWRRGQGYTTHPHDIAIRQIHVGRLTRPSVRETGSFGVRLSGVHDVTVTDVVVQETTEAAFYHTAGDLGYEFARPQDRARAHRGIVLEGLQATRAGSYLIRTDSYADNVGRAAAAGYRPMLPPIAQTDISVRRVTGGAASAGLGYGLRIDHQRGGRFADIEVNGFRRGFYIDEQVYDLALDRPVALNSAEAGLSVEHGGRPPERITVTNPRASGRNANAAAIVVGPSRGVRVVGAPRAAVRVSGDAIGVELD